MKIKLEEFSKQCNCGRPHKLFVEHVLIERGAVHKINCFLQEAQLDAHSVIICDENTYKAAGSLVFDLLKNDQREIIILDPAKLHADEHGVQKVIERLGEKASVLLAVGAGTVHDITRYVAKEKNLPFIAVPTAASVDGFVSTVAAMTIKGFKVTSPAVSPLAVFADTDIFIKAPYKLTASGISDLLGKYTAVLDWQVGNLLTDEYICERIVQIEMSAVQKVVDDLEAISAGNEEAYENLMYALILSGLAMQMIGNSRPASGAEHHLSHLWEMHLINKETDALHGEKVGVALAIVCDVYKKILNIDEIEKHIVAYKGLPDTYLKENFKDLYDSIVKENTPDILNEVNPIRLIQKFEEIKELIVKLPSGETVRELLKKAHAKATLHDIGLENSIIETSVVISPYVRRRLTLMRVLKLID